MWLFTKYGFYSVTRSKTEPQKIQVRARVRADLEALIAAATAAGLAWAIPKFGKPVEIVLPEVLETPEADYRYRIILPFDRWQALAGLLAAEVDYFNFKDQITDPARHRLYTRIWAMLADLQNGVAYVPSVWVDYGDPPDSFTTSDPDDDEDYFTLTPA